MSNSILERLIFLLLQTTLYDFLLISMPLALLTYIATIYFDIEISLTVGIILWILIPSIISGIHFYKLFYKSNR